MSELIVLDVLRSSAGQASVLGVIDLPKPGVQPSTDVLDIVGWAIGLEARVRAVEIIAAGTVVERVPVELERPDLHAAYPDHPDAANAGFSVRMDTLGFSELDIQIQVVLDDGSRHPLAVVRAQRDWPPGRVETETDIVSIVVLGRDDPAQLAATLDSIVVQTYAGFDVTVVASGDPALLAAAGPYPGVRMLQGRGSSRAHAWNAGLAATRGGFVLFLPAGVRLAPAALAASVRALRDHPAWAFAAGGGASGRSIPDSDGTLGSGVVALLRERFVHSGAAVVYRRRAVEAVGAFDDRMLGEEEYDLALRIARRFPIGRHGEVVVEQPHAGDPPVGSVAFGSLRRLTPLSRDFGFDRGLPVDRYYIECFLDQHADDIHGRVLEVADGSYTRRFGGERVSRSDVLSLTADNAEATIVADLADASSLPRAVFDCFILTQTLHLIHDLRAALDAAYRALRPGGVLLVTTPGISQLESVESWHWSLTPLSATRLFADRFGHDNVAVESHGNVLAATAFLFGLGAEELTPEELDHRDRDYPVTIAVRATKPAAKRRRG